MIYLEYREEKTKKNKKSPSFYIVAAVCVMILGGATWFSVNNANEKAKQDIEIKDNTIEYDKPSDSYTENNPTNQGVSNDPDTAATIMARDDKAKIANHGIVVVGSAPKVRALMAYNGGAARCNGYAKCANELKEALGDVNVYCSSFSKTIFK